MSRGLKLRCRDCFPPGLAWMGTAHEAIDADTHEQRCPKCGSTNLEVVGILKKKPTARKSSRSQGPAQGPGLFSFIL